MENKKYTIEEEYPEQRFRDWNKKEFIELRREAEYTKIDVKVIIDKLRYEPEVKEYYEKHHCGLTENVIDNLWFVKDILHGCITHFDDEIGEWQILQILRSEISLLISKAEKIYMERCKPDLKELVTIYGRIKDMNIIADMNKVECQFDSCKNRIKDLIEEYENKLHEDIKSGKVKVVDNN